MVRMVYTKYVKKNWRAVVLWIFASLCFFAGASIAGQLQRTFGVSSQGFLIAFFVSLFFFMLGSLFVIAIAIALKEKEEE